MHPPNGCTSVEHCRVARSLASGASGIADDGADLLVIVIVLARLKLREDIDEFAHATARQRPAGIHQRFIIGDPGLSFREVLHGRAGSDDLGDGYIVGPANRLGNLVTCDALHGFKSFNRLRPPSAADGGTACLSY